MIYINLAADNDTNGNPRRIFVIFDEDGEILDCIDEGYSGLAEVTKQYPNAKYAGRFETTPKEYRSLLKFKKKEK